MALDVGGEHDRAARGLPLAGRAGSGADGSWAAEYRDGAESAPAAESNHAGYLAVGAWHTWLLTGDEELVDRAVAGGPRAGWTWSPAMQLPGGAIGWALRPDGTPDDTALLTGNASLFQALRCGIALAGAARRGRSRTGSSPSPTWARRCATRPEAFADRSRYSMDWYYPVLGGAVTGAAGPRPAGRRLGHASSSPGWAPAASPTGRG